MKRQIVLDTEGTGLSFAHGDRIVEIGCIEIVDGVVNESGVYQQYINPMRSVPREAIAVHGIDDSILKDKPVFSDIAKEFLNFIRDDELIIHNAPFDISFIQGELVLSGFPPIANPVIDTLQMARKMFPGSPASLDVLCKRFNIDEGGRESRHGAFIDAKLLAYAYLEMTKGSQVQIDFQMKLANTYNYPKKSGGTVEHKSQDSYYSHRIAGRRVKPEIDESAKHDEVIDKMENSKWTKKTPTS